MAGLALIKKSMKILDTNLKNFLLQINKLLRFWLPLLALFALLPGCIKDKPKPNEVILKTGDYEFQRVDIKRRDAVAKIYNPNEKRSLGLLQLHKAGILAQVLKNNGRPVTQAILKSEDQRITKRTLMPEKLQRIIDTFEGDKQSYLRTFILPVYVNRTIYYGFFLKNQKIHKESYKKAKSFLNEVNKKPQSFIKLAKELDYSVSEGEINSDGSIKWGAEKSSNKDKAPKNQLIDKSPKATPPLAVQQKMDHLKSGENEFGQNLLKTVFSQIKPKQAYPRVVDQIEVWNIYYLKRTKKTQNGKVHYFAVTTIPKASYQEWLEVEKSKVKTWINPEFQNLLKP